MSTATTTSKSSLSEPRPSASLIIVNARNEILLVHRNPKARSFGGVHVFPGGNFDAKQDDSLAITAIRETFEESGLLIASPSSSVPLDSELDEARHAIHSQKLLFRTFLKENQLNVDISSLLPFTTWITPPGRPQRFRTQFFVSFLPGASSSGFTSGDKQERLPTPDGGQEVISARFIHPQDALSEYRAGKIAIMPPQFYFISTLADILDTRENNSEQRRKVSLLSQGAFGKMVINPSMLPHKDQDGHSVLTYEGDETRGGQRGRLHRVVGKAGKTGAAFGDMVLLRNFDIYTEVDLRAFPELAKL